MSKLTLYNEALMVLGERPTTLTENRESRRVLDHIWDTGVREYALSMGQWNFATRTIEIQYTGDINPTFGFRRAFEKPTDWIRTIGISGDSYFNQPLDLSGYADEAGYIFADYDTIYLKYVSKDSSYGFNLDLWPVNFSRFVGSLMAFEGCERITQSGSKKAEIMKIMEDRLDKALNTDAMNSPAQFAPSGSWVNSRLRGDRSTRLPGGRQF